jgi:predicted TIM-barrel fold metal-dependent hydrolase
MRKEQDIAFIDCDTHFLPLRAVQRLAQLHPSFRLNMQRDVIRFYYNDRVVADSYADNLQSAFLDFAPDPSVDAVTRTLESRVAQMDLEGPGGLSVFGFSQAFCSTNYPPGIGTDVCETLNDATLELLEGSAVRDRFLPVAAIYLPWVPMAAREVRRAHELGFQGIFLGPIWEPHEDLCLGSSALWPVYEAIEAYDMPIVYHSSNRPNKDWAGYQWKTTNAAAMVGSQHPAIGMVQDFALLMGLPFTYSLDIAGLIFSGTLDRFPNLRFCLLEGRMPSFFPALMDALDQARPRTLNFKLQRKPSEYASHFYPAVTATERWLHLTAQAWPDHNMVLGTDFPHTDASGTWPDSVRLINDHPDLSAEDKYRILAGNARRLFNI